MPEHAWQPLDERTRRHHATNTDYCPNCGTLRVQYLDKLGAVIADDSRPPQYIRRGYAHWQEDDPGCKVVADGD